MFYQSISGIKIDGIEHLTNRDIEELRNFSLSNKNLNPKTRMSILKLLRLYRPNGNLINPSIK